MLRRHELNAELVQQAQRRIRHAEMTLTDWTPEGTNPDESDLNPNYESDEEGWRDFQEHGFETPDTLAEDASPVASPVVADAEDASPVASPVVADAEDASPVASPVVADAEDASPVASPVVADAEDASPVASPVVEDERDQRLLDYIASKIAANQGQPVALVQSETKIALGFGLNAVKNREAKLERLGLIFRSGPRKGGQFYQIQGGVWPPVEETAFAIAPTTTGLATGLAFSGAGAAGEVNQGSLVNPPAAPAPDGASLKKSVDSVKPPPCDDCGPAEIYPSKALEQRGIVGAWYCNGHDRSCSWVWQQDVGEVVPPRGPRRYDYDRLALLIQSQIVEGHPRGQKPVWVSTDDGPGARRRESWTPYADAVRAEFGKLAWECRPKRGG